MTGTKRPLDAFVSARIAPLLKGMGFTKAGRTFHHRCDDNWGVINVQASMSNTASYTRFTINVGVASALLRKFDTLPGKSEKPAIWDCHWWERVGHLLPVNRDLWWTLGPCGEPEGLDDESLSSIVELAGREAMQRCSDATLRDAWLAARFRDDETVRRLIVLISAHGPAAMLQPMMRDLEARRGAAFAREYLARVQETLHAADEATRRFELERDGE